MAERFDPEPTIRASGQPVDRRSPQAADSEQRWAAFMTHAAHVLASSLDFRKTVDNVLCLLVPQLADWCIAHVLNEENQLLEVAVAHADPVRNELLHEIVAAEAQLPAQQVKSRRSSLRPHKRCNPRPAFQWLAR